MRASLALVTAALLAPVLPIHAQERKDSGGPAVYRVEFNLHDGSDAAAKAGRRYTVLTDASRKAIFKVGNRVPTATGSFQSGVSCVGVNPLVNTQYTYIDIGVNIECLVSEVVNGKLGLHGSIDISTVTPQEPRAGAANPPNPAIGQTKLDLDTIVEPGKPTVVASIDDPVTMRKLQVEATVTKMN